MPLNYILFKILSHLTKEPVAAATTPELAIHGHCDLSTQQYKLFEGMKFSDVVFVIGGFSLPQIHFSLSKHRLCCHMFRQHSPEEKTTNNIPVEDIDPELFRRCFVLSTREKFRRWILLLSACLSQAVNIYCGN